MRVHPEFPEVRELIVNLISVSIMFPDSNPTVFVRKYFFLNLVIIKVVVSSINKAVAYFRGNILAQ
jgi:hypothetical protein